MHPLKQPPPDLARLFHEFTPHYEMLMQTSPGVKHYLCASLTRYFGPGPVAGYAQGFIQNALGDWSYLEGWMIANGFLARQEYFTHIPPDEANRARLAWLNYLRSFHVPT